MNSLSQLYEALWQQMSPLPARSRSLVFLLSACRHFSLYQYCHEIKQVGDPALLARIQEEIFHHSTHAVPVTAELHQRWCDELLQLHPVEGSAGLLGCVAGSVTIVAYEAGSALFQGETLAGANSMEFCLGALNYKIGLEMLGMSSPGDASRQRFDDVVMNDPRHIQEQRHLENDIATLRQHDGADFLSLAVKLRQQAVEQSWNAAEFCQPLLELEAIYKRQREERLQRMREQRPKS